MDRPGLSPAPPVRPLRLRTASVRRVGGPLRAAVGPAAQPSLAREGALVSLGDDAGNLGLGEASPLPGFSPDTLEAVCAHLEASLPALRDRELPEALEALGVPGADDRSPSERFALETALVDLLGRRRGVPARAILGGDVPVAVNGYAGAALSPSLLADAREILDAGFGALKVKVGGGSFEAERSALGRLRRELGDTFSLRLDANGAWDLATARSRVAALESLDVEFIEQPVAGADLLRLGELAVPWAADESLLDPGVRAAFFADPEVRRGCVAVVLKPALLGGLLVTRAVAVEALRARLGVVVTHLFDGPVALAACRALARSLPMPPLACGLDPHPGLEAWPAVPLSRGPWVEGDDTPGLGITLP